MSNERDGASSSNKPNPSFKLEISDLDPETYLAIQQANAKAEHQAISLVRSTTVPYRAVPAISVSYKSRSASLQSRRIDPTPPSTMNYNPPSTSTGSTWSLRKSGRAGRPRGSRALRPRVGSYTSHFASVAKNLSYRGCLSDLLSHRGGISRLQILNKDLATKFQKYLLTHLAAKQAKEREAAAQMYEPVSSGEVAGVNQPENFSQARSSTMFQTRSYSPICEPVSSPEAGPSGLQYSRPSMSSPMFVSEDQMYQEGEQTSQEREQRSQAEDEVYQELEKMYQEINFGTQSHEDRTSQNIEGPLEISPYHEKGRREILRTGVQSEAQQYENDPLEITPYHKEGRREILITGAQSEAQGFENDPLEITPYHEEGRREILITGVQSEAQGYENDPLEITPYHGRLTDTRDGEESPEEVELYRKPSPEVIEIDDSSDDSVDESRPKLETEGETYMSDLFTISKYYAPPTMDLNPPVVSINPPPVEVNAPTISINPPTVEVNPAIVAINPPTVAVYAPTVAVSPPTVEVYPQTVTIDPPTVEVYPQTVTIDPPTVEVYPQTVTIDPPTVQVSPPTVSVYSNDRRCSTYGSSRFNRYGRRPPMPYRSLGCVPGTYIKLTGSHFYGNRNLELATTPAIIPPVGPSHYRTNLTKTVETPPSSPEPVKEDDGVERLLASPSYDVPELDLFNEDGLTETLSYVKENPEYNKPKPQQPEPVPGPSGVRPPKSTRGHKSSRRKSTVRLATPRAARPSRAKTSRSISGVRSTISDLTELCGKVRTTTEKETLPCGRKVFVGGGLPPFRIPPAHEVQKVAMEAVALGQKIRSSHPSEEEDVLEDIVSWLMDNPDEEDYYP